MFQSLVFFRSEKKLNASNLPASMYKRYQNHIVPCNCIGKVKQRQQNYNMNNIKCIIRDIFLITRRLIS